MKNLFKVAAFFVGTTMIFSSCECKQRTEPIPPTPKPVPPKPPVSTTDGVTLEIPAGTTEFKLYSLLGESITIEGLSDKIVKVEPWGLDAKKVKPFKVENAPATIRIKGNIEELSIYSGNFDKINLSILPKTLRILRIGSKDIRNTNLKVKEFEIKGENNVLESILIGNIGLSGDYDMSSFSALKRATFIRTSAKFTLPNSIEDIMLEQSHGIIKNEMNINTFPNMKEMYFIGSSIGSAVDFSGSKQLKSASFSRSHTPSINLSNTSIQNLLIHDLGSTKELNISMTDLKDGSADKYTIFKGFTALENNSSIINVNIANSSLTNINSENFSFVKVESLNLSNNKLKNANFAHLKSLKNLDLTGNTELIGESLKIALRSLPATNGTLRMSGLDADMKKIVTDKGWTLQEQ